MAHTTFSLNTLAIFTVTFSFLLTPQFSLYLETTPFHPIRQNSSALCGSVGRYYRHMPVFVGAVNATNTVEWLGDCFCSNRAWLELRNDSGSQFGDGILHIEAYDAKDWYCYDLYVFVTPYRVMGAGHYCILSGGHEFKLTEWEGKSEYGYVKHKGISIFLVDDYIEEKLIQLGEVLSLFSGQSHIDFLKDHMNAKFEVRPRPWVKNVSLDDIQSGDFLAISRIRGQRSVFESLKKWITGAYAGHTAVCLRDSEGKLFVGASGLTNEEGQYVIDLLPWDEWWSFMVEDDTDPHIALLPLHPELRPQFNETAAWEYARSMDGKPYGDQNLIFSWIDTVADNYPFPVRAKLVAHVMTVWNHFLPTYASNMWIEALNMRLGTQDLSFLDILDEVKKRGASFRELLTFPEQDDWVYTDGESISCVSFVLQMYKEAGLFKKLASSIQVKEFTVKDAYTLKFFESDSSRLPEWCHDGDKVKLPFCQIKGRYRMELPGYNTIVPYPRMSERCPSMEWDYERPTFC